MSQSSLDANTTNDMPLLRAESAISEFDVNRILPIETSLE